MWKLDQWDFSIKSFFSDSSSPFHCLHMPGSKDEHNSRDKVRDGSHGVREGSRDRPQPVLGLGPTELQMVPEMGPQG